MTWREEAGSHGTAQRTRNRAIAARSQAAYRARRRAERGLVAHNRLKDPDVRRLVDPRTDTILCRLSPDFAGKLTALQVEAGKLVAQIYGEYHRATGQSRRSQASPYYERALAGQGELGRMVTVLKRKNGMSICKTSLTLSQLASVQCWRCCA